MNTFEQYLQESGEIGFIKRISFSLVYADGLPGIQQGELVAFENGEYGQVSSLGKDEVEILSFSQSPLSTNMKVTRTLKPPSIPVGEELLGSVINPLGKPLRTAGSPKTPNHFRSLENTPPGIRGHSRISRPCITGVTVVDTMIPLGKGQRQLVIGDQKTGKTSFLLRVLLTQIKEGAIGIYTAIGKSKLAIRQVEDFLRNAGILDRVIIIATYAEESASLTYLAPYAGMTMAEYFRDSGKDVVLALDDLSQHAKMYREISLLARRSPGRNSYPGDIFYLHARLLERAGNFLSPHGEKSITCFPVIEAPRGDLTGYIQTNTISMTDGHIYFDYNMYVSGRRPAINTFLSVTRVGRQAQLPVQNQINRLLTKFLAEAEKLEVVSSFGAELADTVKITLKKYERVLVFFDQPAQEILSTDLQLFLFALIWNDGWIHLSKEELARALYSATQSYTADSKLQDIIAKKIARCKTLDDLLHEITDPDEYFSL